MTTVGMEECGEKFRSLPALVGRKIFSTTGEAVKPRFACMLPLQKKVPRTEKSSYFKSITSFCALFLQLLMVFQTILPPGRCKRTERREGKT